MARLNFAIASFFIALCAASCAPSNDAKSARTAGTSAKSDQPKKEAGGDVKSSSNDVREDYDEMVRILKLSDEEAKQLKAAFDEREKVVSKWMEEKGRQLDEFEKKMLEAAKSKDLGSLQNWKQKAEPLRKELVDSVERFKGKIREALPEKKRLEWEAHKLAERLLELMKSLKLTEKQIIDVRAKADSAARESAGEPNPQAAGFLKAEREVETDVLSLQQRERYQAVKKQHPLRSMKE